VIPALKPLYNYAWFVGFFVSGASYFVLTRAIPVSEPKGSTEAA
jgi:cytosine/uracil/thiamine/allantoin permease